MLRTSLGMQKQLSPAHSLDRRGLALVWTFGHIHLVTSSNLISLHIQGHRPIRGLISLSTQFFWAYIAGNAVVVDDCEIFTADTDNDTHFICRSATTQHNQVVQFIASKFILARRYLSRFSKLGSADRNLFVCNIRQNNSGEVCFSVHLFHSNNRSCFVGVSAISDFHVCTNCDVLSYLTCEKFNFSGSTEIQRSVIRFDLDCSAIHAHEFSTHAHQITLNNLNCIADQQAIAGRGCLAEACCLLQFRKFVQQRSSHF
mmetsp:Transcript_114383/g.330466  ORF Transcript_114383/g.330466 Transcript_114383/m.330466 type:complete len:258 (-) Transcript_114383:93-866(-)